VFNIHSKKSVIPELIHPGTHLQSNGYEVDELRDLPITKKDILLTHSCQWADTSTILIERKRCDVRLALKGGEIFLISVFTILPLG
jgi:hypothetical protein